MSHNGKSKSSEAEKSAPPKFRYINYDLLVADHEWLASADTTVEFPAKLLDDAVVEGYKYSLSPDLKNNCFIASLTDRQVGSAFENSCLMGRGATPTAARVSLLYRHVVLAQGDWSYFTNASASTGLIYG